MNCKFLYRIATRQQEEDRFQNRLFTERFVSLNIDITYDC